MNSQLQREKKRIARIGKTCADVEDKECDFMSKIIKEMDLNFEDKKTLTSLNKEQRSHTGSQNTIHVPTEASNSMQNKVKMPKPPRKYFPDKKYPLMEKCQRNIKYLKHNRSVPKQRAHIGFIPNSPKIRVNNSLKNRKLTKYVEKRNLNNLRVTVNMEDTSSSDSTDYSDDALNEDSDFDKTALKENDAAFKGKSDFNETAFKEDSDLSGSDINEDSEFENFIRTQKEMLECDETDDSGSSIITKTKNKRRKRESKEKDKRHKRQEKRDTNLLSTARKELNSHNGNRNPKRTLDGNSEYVVSKDKGKKHKTKHNENKPSNMNNQNLQYKKFICENQSSDSCFESGNMKGNNSAPETSSNRNFHERDISYNESAAVTCADEMDYCESSDSHNLHRRNIDCSSEVKSESNNNNNGCRKITPSLSFDLTKADTKYYIKKYFTCSVRIKRNPSVETKIAKEIAVSSNMSAKINIPSRSVVSFERSNVNNDHCITKDNSSVITLDASDSDDDCKVLCVVPKPYISPSKDNDSNSYPNSNPITADPCPNIYSNLKSTDNDPISADVSNVKMSNKASTENTADKDPELNIKIAAVHSLTEPDYSLNTFPVVCPKALATVSSKNLVTANEDVKYMSNELEENRPQIVIPNLDELLSNIDFKLITQISKDTVVQHAPLVYDVKNSAEFVKSVPDTAGIDTLTNEIKDSYNENEYVDEHVPTRFQCSQSLSEEIESSYDSLNRGVPDPNCYFNYTSSNVLRSVNFGKDYEVGKPGQLMQPCIENDNSIPIQQSFITSEKTERTTLPVLRSGDTFWRNLKDSVNKTNSGLSELCPELRTVPNIEDKQNICKFSNKNASAMTSVPIQPPETFCNDIKTFQIHPPKQELCENPADELDIIAAKSIRELYEQKESIAPLFNLYSKELKHYDEIVSTEVNVSAGLKMLEEEQAKRIKYIAAAIHNLVKHDPCFHKIKEEKYVDVKSSSIDRKLCVNVKDKTEVNQERTECASQVLRNEDRTMKGDFETNKARNQIRKCVNCEQPAKFLCQRCKKVFYCSSECGMNYWEKEHSASCL